MTGNEIVREEAGRLARGMLALMLISGGLLTLCGQGSVRMAVSLVVGTAFTLALFVLMASNVARSVGLLPERAEAYVRRGYAVRYLLAGAFVVFVIKTPYFQPLAAILPFFFPKAVLLTRSIFQRKGG